MVRDRVEDVRNPFNLTCVVLNLPGSKKYESHKPRVYKVRKDGQIACEVLIYVENGRGIGSLEQLCWEVLQ